MEKIEFLWKDRKRPICGLPLSFTKYKLTDEKLLITTGIFNLKEEEIKLYRILDITLKRNFLQRIFGVGTIHCCSSDKTAGEFDILDIKNSVEVKEMLSKLVEDARDKKRISGREFMNTSTEDFDEDVDEH